ncbi:MAG: 23S rRNA (guanosine(2251)-2'-O)-methyltransferase RlmB [Candidatus Omnitrophica bacterium]|nr:23S rRNA (guanosine(2251)-2'-O)-methyltransferase RlmB [Candidatus Omnitrophota bacterium]
MKPKKTYLYGKNSVLERLKANPKSIHQIFLQDNFDAPQIIDLITAGRIPIRRVSERELYRIKRAERLQGIVAQVEKYKYTPFDELLDNPPEKKFSFVFLDNINDPHNLGSVLRIAACFGGFGVVIHSHGSCQVNDTVIHVASGGENFVPVSMVSNLSRALVKAKKKGFWVVGTVLEDGGDLKRASFPFPLCLVLGSEGKGIRQGIEKLCDIKLTLPMRGAALSFNVAMATAIFCYEIEKQRDGRT